MEYTVKMTISPSDYPSIMVARVFIAVHNDDGQSYTAQIWQCTIPAEQPIESSDPMSFAAAVVAAAGFKLGSAYMETIPQGQVNSLGELFGRQFSLRVGAGHDHLGRP